MTSKLDWEGRTGHSWAREWQRTDRSFGGLTDRLMGRASERPVRRALDIGCGAGEVSLALARGHPGAEIIGIDVSEELIDVAQERGGNLANVHFECADAGAWSEAGFAPDLLVSRHGVMFFDDPVASFTHLHAVAAPDARLVFSCFRAMEENVWADRIAGLLPPGLAAPPDRFSPGPFAFADQSHVSGILREAGWLEIAFEPVDFAYIAGAGPDAVEDALSYFLTIGPAARGAAALGDDERAHFVGRLRRFLANNLDGDLVALRAAAWIVTAHSQRR